MAVQLPWLGSVALSRAIPLVASGVLHGALLVNATAGGAAHAAPAPERVMVAEIVESTVDVDMIVDEAPKAPEAARAPDVATHTHAYPVPASHHAAPHDPSLHHDHDEPAPSPTPADAPAPAPVSAVAAPADAPAPTFTLKVAPLVARAPSTLAGQGTGGSGIAPSAGAAGAGTASEAVVPESAVTVRATLASSVTAAYPPDARAGEVEADVPLEIVVGPSGAVQSARVVRRAGFGFDESALAAIRRYRFSPARLAGQPVRVRMRWSVQFRLR